MVEKKLSNPCGKCCRKILLTTMLVLLVIDNDSVAAFMANNKALSQGAIHSTLQSVQTNQIKRIRSWPTTYTKIHGTLPLTALQMSMTPPQTQNGVSPKPTATKTRATAVYALMLINLVVFLLDKVFRYRFVAKQLYLFHRRWTWWQPLTTCFCHMDRFHLSNNLFLLLLFGRSVEDDQGWGGLLFSYAFCGVAASLVSIFLLPKGTVSIGASGAVFGLFAVSTLAKLSWRDLDWRKLVEVAVLGEFVFRQLTSEIATAAGGGIGGVNHVAHLSGAAAGALLVFVMRYTVARSEDLSNSTRN